LCVLLTSGWLSLIFIKFCYALKFIVKNTGKF
jgi:hypothetical protein